MSKISPNKAVFDILEGTSKVDTLNLNATGISTINTINSTTNSISDSVKLPLGTKSINQSLYYKSDNNLYGYIDNKEIKINGSSTPVSLSEEVNYNYKISDLIRTDESTNELYMPEMVLQDEANYAKSSDIFQIETGLHTLSYRTFQITPAMNPSLTAPLEAVQEISSLGSNADINQLLVYEILNLSIITQISSISINLDVDATYRFDELTLNCSVADLDTVFDYANNAFSTGFGYELVANSGQVLSFYVVRKPVKNTSSVSFIIYSNKDQSFTPSSADIPTLIFSKINMGTQLRFQVEKSYLINDNASASNFIIEHFNIVVFQNKLTKAYASLLVSYNPLLSNFKEGFSADNQLYFENIPQQLIDFMINRLTPNDQNNMAIGIARIPFLASTLEGSYYNTSDATDVYDYPIVDSNSKIRRLFPCAVDESNLYFKCTMLPDSGNKYQNFPLFSLLNSKISYNVVTELLDVSNTIQSCICGSLVIGSIFINSYYNYSSYISDYTLNMERGSVWYEKLTNEAVRVKAVNTRVQSCSYRAYNFMGRDKEPLKQSIFYIDQSEFEVDAPFLLTQFTINNISSQLLRQIRLPASNSYKPKVDVVLSLTGKGIDQVQNNYLTNILYN